MLPVICTIIPNLNKIKNQANIVKHYSDALIFRRIRLAVFRYQEVMKWTV